MANTCVPFPVGTVRGPYDDGDPKKPGVTFMVQGRNGWVPFHGTHRSKDEAETRRAAEAYARKILAKV